MKLPLSSSKPSFQDSAQQLRQIMDDHMSALRFQRIPIAVPGDADDKRKAAARPRLDTRESVLDHHGTVRRHAQHLGGLQKAIGCGFALEALLDSDFAVDAC